MLNVMLLILSGKSIKINKRYNIEEYYKGLKPNFLETTNAKATTLYNFQSCGSILILLVARHDYQPRGIRKRS